jgi:hypothetical protein
VGRQKTQAIDRSRITAGSTPAIARHDLGIVWDAEKTRAEMHQTRRRTRLRSSADGRYFRVNGAGGRQIKTAALARDGSAQQVQVRR